MKKIKRSIEVMRDINFSFFSKLFPNKKKNTNLPYMKKKKIQNRPTFDTLNCIQQPPFVGCILSVFLLEAQLNFTPL